MRANLKRKIKVLELTERGAEMSNELESDRVTAVNFNRDIGGDGVEHVEHCCGSCESALE